MSNLQQRELPRRGSRHPLLLYRRLNEVTFWPSVLIVAACATLLIWNPVEFEPFRPHLSVILAGTSLFLALTFALRSTAYVQCRGKGLRVQLPLYHLTIPYREIRITRPTELFRLFPPREQSGIQRHFLEGLIGKTVIVLEMDKLPHPESWLRLWMSKYMISPDIVGLVLPVRDWIAFRTELDDFRARSRHYHD